MVLLQWSCCWLSLVCTVVLSRFQIAMSKREKFFQSRGVQVLCLPTYYTHKRQQQQQLSPPQSSDYSSNKVDSQPTTTIIHFICGKQSKVQLFPFGTSKNKTFKIVCHKSWISFFQFKCIKNLNSKRVYVGFYVWNSHLW